MLSLRLKQIIPSLISPNQGGFISGKQISDNILMVQEAIHSSSKRGEPGMAIKLYLANAFDRLRHCFILFGPKEIWLSTCFYQSSSSLHKFSLDSSSYQWQTLKVL